MPNIDGGLSESPDMMKDMPIEIVFDFLAIQLDSERLGDKSMKINVVVDGEVTEKYALVLRNRVLNYLKTRSINRTRQ